MIMNISLEERNGSKTLEVFNTYASDLGEPVEEMNMRGGELNATDEPTVVSELLFDSFVVEDGQSDGHLANSTGADESDWYEVLRKTNYLLD